MIHFIFCLFFDSFQDPFIFLFSNLLISPSSEYDQIIRVCELSCCSRVQHFATPGTVAHRPLCPWHYLGKNTGVGCHAILQMIFPTQGSNACLFVFCIIDRFFYHWTTREGPWSSHTQSQTISFFQSKSTLLWTYNSFLQKEILHPQFFHPLFVDNLLEIIMLYARLYYFPSSYWNMETSHTETAHSKVIRNHHVYKLDSHFSGLTLLDF